MNCAACLEQLNQMLDGTDTLDRAALDLHLDGCAGCRSYRDLVVRLHTGLRLLRLPEPPPGLSARLVAAVQRDRQQARRRSRLRFLVGCAAAACVVAGVALALWPGRPPTPAPTVPVVALNTHPEPPPTAVATATPRQSVETAVEAMASLTSRTTHQTVEQTKKLMPLVEPSLAPLTWEPTLPTLSLNGTGHGVREGLEPMETHAKRAVGLLRRDMLPDF